MIDPLRTSRIMRSRHSLSNSASQEQFDNHMQGSLASQGRERTARLKLAAGVLRTETNVDGHVTPCLVANSLRQGFSGDLHHEPGRGLGLR